MTHISLFAFSLTAALMSCFKQKQVQDERFPVLSRGLRDLKEEEKELGEMCDVMEGYNRIAREEGRTNLLKELEASGLLTKEQLARFATGAN